MEKVTKVEWTEKAKLHLKKVYKHHAEYNEISAFELTERIIYKAPNNLSLEL